MYTRFADMPMHIRERLLLAQRQGGFGQGSFFLKRGRPWLLWMGLVASGVGGLCAAVCFSMQESERHAMGWAFFIPAALALIGLFYGVIALVEFFRTLKADLKPFILVTPTNIVQCKGSHQPLAIFRLAEATAFNQTNAYNREQWKGMDYIFSFGPKERIAFLLRRKEDMAVLDETLALARAKGKGETLPNLAGARESDLKTDSMPAAPGRAVMEQLAAPASEFWIIVAALALIGVIVAIAAGSRR
jgi:hypothetical protein